MHLNFNQYLRACTVLVEMATMCICILLLSALLPSITVIAFGKAVIGMVKAIEEILSNHVIGGVACVPAGILTTLGRIHPEYLPDPQSRIRYVTNQHLLTVPVLLCN